MSHNPYLPPDATPVSVKRKGSPICTVMFWLSCVLCVGAFGIAANGGYQYWFYTSQMAIPLPANILAETVCVAFSGLGMLYSAIRWRRQLMSAGAVSFACSLLAFFVGPLLM